MTTKMVENMETGFEVAGISASVGSLLMIAWNELAKYIDINTINPWLVFITGVVGLLFMLSKWRGQRLSNKQKKIEIDLLSDQLSRKKRNERKGEK